jgi:hypothetical protein
MCSGRWCRSRPGWPRPPATIDVPGVERVGARHHRPHRIVGIGQVGVVAHGAVEVLAQQLQPQVTGVATRRVPAPGRVGRLPRVVRRVEHGDGQLAVVAPGTPVEVGAARRRPDVVDHGDLGVDVDGASRVVLQVEHVHAVRRLPAAHLQRLQAAHQVGRPRQPAVDVGVSGHHHREVQARAAAQGVGEQAGDVRRPRKRCGSAPGP